MMPFMKMIGLALGASEQIVASFTTSAGEQVSATFTISEAGDVTVGNPEPDIFTGSNLSVDEVRRIVAAVIAFEHAART